MPRRDHARPIHARPAPDRPSARPSPAAFLPPQPLADRDRHRRLGRASLAAIAVGAGLVLVVPLALGVLGSAAGPLEPLAGGVAGAVSGSERPEPAASSPSASPEPSSPPPVIAPPPGIPASAPPVGTLTGYRWPIAQGWISLPFAAIPGGEWINDGKRFHDGVDLASFCGARVGAAHDGVVLAAGRHFDEQIGWIGDLQPYFHLLDVRHMWNDLPIAVVIDDGNGYRSIYAHFRDVTVKVGEHVRAGQMIGHEGATGHASGCHVHYGLFSPLDTGTFGVRADILKSLRLPRTAIARVDPLAVLPGGEVALRTRQIAKAIAAAQARALAEAEAARRSVLAAAPAPD